MSPHADLLGCAFCGKRASAVNKLIAASKASICDECVMLCVGIIANGDVKRFDALVKRARAKLPPKPG